jgi:molybdopterin-guanine dinucleotide biosynthesis protein A
MASTYRIAGVILAGGQSRRMGGHDKALATLAGRPLIRHAIDRLRPQVNLLALNANGDPARFEGLGLPVVGDTIAGSVGPLAGIFAGLSWAERQRPMPEAIVTAAVDTPFFPLDLVNHLALAAAARTGIAVARSRGRIHPVFACVPIDCANDLEDFLRRGESRKVTDWLDRAGFAAVDFAGGEGAHDPFFNVNEPADLAVAEASILHDHLNRNPER